MMLRVRGPVGSLVDLVLDHRPKADALAVVLLLLHLVEVGALLLVHGVAALHALLVVQSRRTIKKPVR